MESADRQLSTVLNVESIESGDYILCCFSHSLALFLCSLVVHRKRLRVVVEELIKICGRIRSLSCRPHSQSLTNAKLI